jgi:hypothetical protein
MLNILFQASVTSGEDGEENVVSCIASDIAMEDEEDVAGCSASGESIDDYDTSSLVIGEGKSQLSFLFKLLTMNITGGV